MKVFLINLDRSRARLTHMTAQLSRLDIAYERVSAVDGAEISPRQRAAIAAHLTAGEIGCILSHQSIWRRLAAGTDEHAIVLEDDVILSGAFREFALGNAALPPDADLIKLETTLQPVTVDCVPAAVCAGTSLVRLRSGHYGSAAYVISKAAAAKFLLDKPRPVDFLLFSPRSDRVVYQADSAVAVQDDSDPDRASLIRPERRQARRTLSGALPALIAKMRHSAEKRVNSAMLSIMLEQNSATRRTVPFGQA